MRIDLTSLSCGELYWRGCYGSYDGWKNLLVEDSWSHPAKMAPLLAERILEHLEAQKAIDKKSTRIVDFMAGIGTTNIVASLKGYRSLSVELEKKYVMWQKGNRRAFESIKGLRPQWKILRGDSRMLSKILGNGGARIMSPPYSFEQRGLMEETLKDGKNWFERNPHPETGKILRRGHYKSYGLKAGLVSPPYLESQRGHGGIAGAIMGEKGYTVTTRLPKASAGYLERGISKKSISRLPDAGVISPPYAETMSSSGHGIDDTKFDSRWSHGGGMHSQAKHTAQLRYSPSEENIGNADEETYQSAMLKVYSEAFKAGISPLVTVTKNPTRNRKLRRLDIDTAYLLKRAGYELYDYHRAVLWKKEKYREMGLKNSIEIKGEPEGRISFFKRLHMNKGLPIARWEDVIFSVIRR